MQIPCHKEVISGTTYDTATAALVGWVHDDEVDSDDEAIRQYLMRNVDGRFFLLHDLGSLTRRASLRIIPVTSDKALHWCETHGVDKDTTAHFFVKNAQAANQGAPAVCELLNRRWRGSVDSGASNPQNR
jgi:hypothetical protein